MALQPVQVFNATGEEPVKSYEYDAYGNTTILDASGNPIGNQQSEIGNRYMFQGREYDSSTGLYYFRARWYDPDSGRWLSKDLIGIEGGLNQYEFCGSNPVNQIDPSGQGWLGWAGAFMQAAGGALMVIGVATGNLAVFGVGAGVAIAGAVAVEVDNKQDEDKNINKANKTADEVNESRDYANKMMKEMGQEPIYPE